MINKLKFSDSSTNIFNRNKAYYDVVEAIKRRFESMYSPIYDLCEQILNGILSNKGNYHLLLGLVQSGKSLPISWLVWSLNFRKEFHKPTILMTINLDTVRRDFMGKIGPSGIVQKIVYEVCQELTDLTTEEINYFFCPRPFDLPALKAKKVLEIGEVPILILQPHNHKGVIRSFLRFVTGPTKKVPVFIIDEVHSLYSGTQDFIENNGLLRKDKHTNRGMISWLQNKVKEYQTCMIGITATPYRSMADTHVYPDKGCVYKLPLVAPVPNMKYYGQGGDGKINIQIRPHYISSKVGSKEPNSGKKNSINKNTGDFNYEIIQEIMDRPAFLSGSDKKVEVPLILITLERYNMQQEELRNGIKARFGDRVYCEVINQNGDPKLDEYFNQCLETSDKVCKGGACIIIGNNSLKAGISVKPAPGQICKKLIEGQEYFISGITDQISDLSKINGESDMQLLRILGWYPEYHQCNLWLSDEKARENYYELYHIYEQFVEAYDGHPSNVKEIITTADQICGGYCHYGKNTRSNCKVHKQFLKLEDATELSTQVIFLSDLPDLVFEPISQKISDFFKKANLRNRFRTELFNALKLSDIEFDTTRFQIPTSKQRLNEIIDSVFLPGDKDQWKVNSFLYGPEGEQSKLSDSYIIWFDDPYDTRLKLSQENPSLCFWLGSTGLTSTLAEISCGENNETRDSWVSATFKPMMTHKNLDIVDRSLSETHVLTIKEMTDLAESEKETNLSSWHLCMKACKIVIGKGSTAIAKMYYNHSDNLKAQMQKIGKSAMLEHEKLDKIVEIIKNIEFQKKSVS